MGRGTPVGKPVVGKEQKRLTALLELQGLRGDAEELLDFVLAELDHGSRPQEEPPLRG